MMQRLIYTNLRGESLAFGYGGPWLLAGVKGLGTCDNDISLTNGNGQDGGRIQSIRRESRTITATVQLLGQSRRDMYDQRIAACQILSPSLAAAGEERARLLYENDAGAWWTWAAPQGGLDWGKRIMDIHTGLSIHFECESPFFYGRTPNEAVFRRTRGGFGLPFSFPLQLGSRTFAMRVYNNGSAFAPVTVTVEGGGETPVLLNESTGASLSLVTPLPEGDRLTIRTDPGRLSVTIRRKDGTEQNAFGYLDPLSCISGFGLKPGVNELRYVPGGATTRSTIRVKWYDTFEGV